MDTVHPILLYNYMHRTNTASRALYTLAQPSRRLYITQTHAPTLSWTSLLLTHLHRGHTAHFTCACGVLELVAAARFVTTRSLVCATMRLVREDEALLVVVGRHVQEAFSKLVEHNAR